MATAAGGAYPGTGSRAARWPWRWRLRRRAWPGLATFPAAAANHGGRGRAAVPSDHRQREHLLLPGFEVDQEEHPGQLPGPPGGRVWSELAHHWIRQPTG